MTDKDALRIASWLVADELCGERTEYCGKSCIECCYAVQERLRQMAQREEQVRFEDKLRTDAIEDFYDMLKNPITLDALANAKDKYMVLAILKRQVEQMRGKSND